MFPLDAEKLGITICEDCWNDKNFWAQRLYERDPVAELVAQGSTFDSEYFGVALHDRQARRCGTTCCARSPADSHVPVVYVNQVGGNDSLIFDGSSVAIMPDGRVAALAKSFEDDLVIFDTATGAGDIRPQPLDELAAAYHALVVGTRDYVRKCGFRKVVMGLSGGVDSALVATIAADALGRKMCWAWPCRGRIRRKGSMRDAQRLAENLGIQSRDASDYAIFSKSYRGRWRRTFAGLPEDAAEENIQARIRGNLLMALSNKFGSMVLSTGNKSEMAVGYCTLYGDMAGGLAVISDVPKTMVYELAKFVNREEGADSAGDDYQGAVGGVAAESDGPGHAAALRRAGPDFESVRGGSAEPGRDRGALRISAGSGAVGGAARGSE